MIIYENLERLLYIADIHRKDGNYDKAFGLILTVAHELAKPIDFSQVSDIIEDETRFNEADHPRDKKGKFTYKSDLEHIPKDYTFQSEKALRNGIRKDLRQIDIHSDKLKNPKKYIADWEQKNTAYQEGCIKHWQKEIENFYKQIKFREDELKRRGKNDK